MDLERKIYHEQIRLIYLQGPILVIGATFCAVIMTVFLWQYLPQSTLVIWIAALLLCTVVRVWVIALFLRAEQRKRRLAFWGPLFWLGTLAAGVIWGAWPLVFYEMYGIEHLLLISTIFAGMVAVSSASGCVYLPSFLTFSIPLTLPLAVTHLSSGIDSLVLTGLLLISFLVVNLVLAIRGQRQYRNLIRSQLRNQELLEHLAGEKRIAERAIVAKSRFLASASHDLRQPLHAMGLFLSALRRRETDADKLEILDDMSRSAEALNGLFNSLLDVSRLDAEIIEVEPSHLLANDLFDRLRAQFVTQAEAKGLALEVQANAHTLYADAILLERILRNLLANAVQYTSSGSISLTCENDSNGGKCIVLRDTGIGIPEEASEEVFCEYFQLNNPSRDRSNGLGLGLAIVRRLCELMDMHLQMHSVLGRGTEFRLKVPGGDSAQLQHRQMAPITELRGEGRTVLVIDDERQVLQSMRHLLEGWGCEVLLAESARDALKVIALSERTPELILSDYRLRDGQNGVDAVLALREAVERCVPAAVITGDTSPDRLREISDAGLEVLHKPVNESELLSLMQAMFASRVAQGSSTSDSTQSGSREPVMESVTDSGQLADTARPIMA